MFLNIFQKILRIENLNYKTKILSEDTNIMQKNQFLKAKNSLLELEIDFIELEDRKLKDGEVKSKR